MSMKKVFFIALAALLFATSGTIQSVSAQDDSEKSVIELEDVTVTARKMEENLQDTPIAVTVFTGDTLESRQVFTTELLDQVTPNLQFTNNTTLAGNNASSLIVIRGIGQVDPTSTVDPGVGIYIDDVYMSQSIGGTMDFRDISGVQVLRGPQGTLFGKNTVGGAILLTTKDPGDEFGGTFRVGYGSDKLRDSFVAVDVPLSDTFKTRFTFGSRNQKGYVIRTQTGEDLGDTNTYTMTGKAVWTPNDRFTAKLKYDYSHSDENGNPFVFAAATETATFVRVASADAGCPGFDGVWNSLPAVPMIDDLRCANDFQNKGPFSNNGTYPMRSLLTNWGIALNLGIDLSNTVTFKSITSYRVLNWDGTRDADNTPLAILHTDYTSRGDQFSEEAQLLYGGDRLKGVLGLYYFEEYIDDIVYVELNTPAPGVQGDSDNNITDNESWAVFLQGTYDLTDQLSVTLGGRYTEDTKGSIPDQFNYADPEVKYLPVHLYEETFDATTVSASINYRWNENIMTYLSYAEGFKGGGWNSHFNRVQTPEEQAQFQSFGPEEADTFELGFKTDLLNYRLRLNGAIFTTDYTDLQFTYRVGVAPYLANAGEASIDGFELEATWLPTDNLLITGGVGHLDTSVDTLVEIAGTGIGVAVGNVLPFSPDWQINLGVGYTAHLNNGWTLTPRADFSYNGETYFDANNTPEIAQLDSASVLNLSLALAPSDLKWQVIGGINNANDEVYPTGGNSSLSTSSGYGEIAYARPREFFISFTYDF